MTSYFQYEIPGFLKTQTWATEADISEVEAMDWLPKEAVFIRKISQKEYWDIKTYNNSKKNPWNC